MPKSKVKVFNNFIKSNFKHISIYAFIFLLASIALKIRLTGLNQYYLTLDDTYDLANSSYHNIFDFINYNFYRDNHPLIARFFLYSVQFFSTDYMALRWTISIIPCLICIPIYYYIGKEHESVITGIIMSWIICFSQVVVLFSQTLRQYSIYVLFLAITFNYLLLHLKTRSKKHQYLYLFFAFISLYIHYQTIVIIAAVAAFITIDMLIRKKRLLEVLEWVLLNATILLTLKLYVTNQIAGTGQPDIFFSYTSTPTEIRSWFSHFLIIYDQILINNRAFTNFAFFFFLLGIVKLISEKKVSFLIIFLLIISINIYTEFAKYLPFFTLTRRVVFYLPFLAFITGAGVSLFYIIMRDYLYKKYKNRSITNAVLYISVSLLLIKTTFTTYEKIKNTEFYRTPAEKSLYFMLPKTNYDLGIKFLSERVGSNDIFFIDGLTANYFIYKIGRDKVIKVTNNVSKIEYNGWQIYFNDDSGWPRMDHPEHIKRNLSELDGAINLSKYNKIWYLNLSWDTALLSRQYTSFPEINSLIESADDKYSLNEPSSGIRSLVIYSIKWENIKNILGVK